MGDYLSYLHPLLRDVDVFIIKFSYFTNLVVFSYSLLLKERESVFGSKFLAVKSKTGNFL